MSILQSGSNLTRRHALKLGAGMTGGMIAAATLAERWAFAQGELPAPDHHRRPGTFNTAPPPDVQHEIESIVEAPGTVSNGVLSININRTDITGVTVHGVPVTPEFLLNGTLVFQRLQGNQVMMNADMALRAKELDPFISAMIQNNIVFQAEHQHLYDLQPLVWFTHFRMKGRPDTVARAVKAALNVTSTPFPQTASKHPTTPLPAQEIGQILGAKPSIMANGVIQYQIPRAESMMLGGAHINPYLNVESPVVFQPLHGGKMAAAVPDFGMIAPEINNVVGTMRRLGWDIGCLYNQETDEYPQLYFSHNFKTGNPIQLAHEIRQGFSHMNVKMM